MNKIYLLGIGHNTPVFMDLAVQCGFEIAGLYHYNDQRTGEVDHGSSILGSFKDLFALEDLSNMNFLLTMGDNLIRTETADKIRNMGGHIPSIIHPTAVVSRFATIAEGVVISPFTIVQADSKIGRDTIILSGVNISHNNSVGAGCFIAGGATVGAYTEIGNFVFIGQGVLTISGKAKRIGEHAFIGAGSLVTKPVRDRAKIVGRPARNLLNLKITTKF